MSIFIPNMVLDHVFFQRGFVLEGGGTLRTDEHVINVNLKRKKSIFIRCLTRCSFSEVLFLKEVGHWGTGEHVNMNLKRKKSNRSRYVA
jgi:hypothetical protein